MDGYIKLWRKLLKWEWIDDSRTFHLFIVLLLLANYEDGEWHGIAVKRGQFITGRKKLSEITGISEQSIRTSLKRLKSTNEITNHSTSKYSVITLINYDKYQSYEKNQPSNQPSNQQTTNQQLTTTKKGKNDKNIFIGKYHKEITLHDGNKAIQRFGVWYSALDPTVKIDTKFYPELKTI